MADRESRADCYRQLAEAMDDVHALINFIALLPYAVRIDRAAVALSRIPQQRRPVDLWPRPAPPGTPAKPNTKWGTRSNHR